MNFVTFFLNVMKFGLNRVGEVEYSLPERAELKFKEFVKWQLSMPTYFKWEEQQYPIINRVGVYKLAIMFSGGLDSAIAYKYARRVYNYQPEDIIAIHVNYGAPYEKAEMETWRKWKSIREKICINLHVPTIQYDEMLLGYIIPFRNSLFAAIGSMFSSQVWLAANYRYEPYKEDNVDRGVSDKSVKFFNRVSELLSAIHNHPVRVWSPFQHLSKSDCIKWAYDSLPTREYNKIIENTITCYNPIISSYCKPLNCGRCFTCWKLWQSYKNSGVPLSSINYSFAMSPSSDPNIKEYEKRELNKGR